MHVKERGAEGGLSAAAAAVAAVSDGGTLLTAAAGRQAATQGQQTSAMHAKRTPERCLLRLCLQKAKAAWTSFIKGCEILNVNEVSCPVLDPELPVWQPDLLQHHRQQPPACTARYARAKLGSWHPTHGFPVCLLLLLLL